MKPNGEFNQTVRVLIVDDFQQVRQELRTLLDLAGSIAVIGEAADGREAVDLTMSLAPDVVLLDLEMPGTGGLEAASQIRAQGCPCRIVALTVHGEERDRQLATAAGCDAFVIKGGPAAELVDAVRGWAKRLTTR